MFKGPAQHTRWLRLNNGVLGRYLTKGRLPLAHEGDHFAFGFPRFLRIESYDRSSGVHRGQGVKIYEMSYGEMLDSLSIEKRERSWNQTLAEPTLITLVGCDAGHRVVGFICGGAERTGQLGCNGELHATYLLQIALRQGLGTRKDRKSVV